MYGDEDFDGFAIGGLVPRAQDSELIVSIVEAVRTVTEERPLHVFGLGKPDLLPALYDAGVTSVDSSSYVQYAASGKLWGSEEKLHDATVTDRLHLALCNLAAATQQRLPLSTTGPLFTTFDLKGRAA
jgi:helicase